MNPEDFTYLSNFPTLASGQISSAADIVSIQFYGALQFWAQLPPEIRDAKRTILLNFLVGWYLANMYPGEVTGVISNGGMPVNSKSIGGTSINFYMIDGVQDALKVLETNTFGLQALNMILSSIERFNIYG